MEWGIGIPKEREVDKWRDVCEWDSEGCVCESIGTPSMLRLIRGSVTLVMMLPTLTIIESLLEGTLEAIMG